MKHLSPKFLAEYPDARQGVGVEATAKGLTVDASQAHPQILVYTYEWDDIAYLLRRGRAMQRKLAAKRAKR